MQRNGNRTFDDALDDFMIYCQDKHLRAKTMISYEATLKLFFRYLEDNFEIVNIGSIREAMCSDYISYTKARGKYTFAADDRQKILNNPEGRGDFGKKVSASTINNYIRNLKVFFNYLIEENKINKIQ